MDMNDAEIKKAIEEYLPIEHHVDEKENGYMDNNGGNVNAADLATLSLIRPGGGGYGYGMGGSYGNQGSLYTGNNVLAAEAHANGTAISAEIKCVKDLIGASNQGIIGAFENATRDRQFTDVKDGMVSAEFRTGDRLRDLEDKISINASAAALCCCDAKLEAQKNACDTQKLVIAENSATRTLILEVEARGVRDTLAAANAKIVQLETINALSQNNSHHGGH